MSEVVQRFLFTLADRIGKSDALRLGLRLLRVRRLESESSHLQRLFERENPDLSELSPEERNSRMQAFLRDNASSTARVDDLLERILKAIIKADPTRAPSDSATAPGESQRTSGLSGPSRDVDSVLNLGQGPAQIREVNVLIAYVESFSGEAGRRLREPSISTILGESSPKIELAEILLGLVGTPIGVEHLNQPAYEALERSLRDSMIGPEPDQDYKKAWSELSGAPIESQTERAQLSGAGIEVEIEHHRRVTWAMERNGIPIVNWVKVRNSTRDTITDLHLRLQLGPRFSMIFETPIPALGPDEERELSRPDIRLDGTRLGNINEREPAALHVELRSGSTTLVSESHQIEILAFNEWDRTALPELLVAFVQPNDKAIAKILALARDILTSRTGDSSLSGYQSKSRARVRSIVEAVATAIQELKITYVNPPASFERCGQKVRVPEQILENRMATCLDLAVMVAAALEQSGLQPLILLIDGHAIPACWLVDDFFPVAATDDRHTLWKLIEVGEILAFDPTEMIGPGAAPVVDAENAAKARLKNEDAEVLIVDVRAARLSRILPIPSNSNWDETGQQHDRAQSDAPAALDPTSLKPLHSVPGRETDKRAPKSKSRIDVWKERLLDLSARNRLLHFKPSRTLSVSFAISELDRLEDALWSSDGLQLEPQVQARGGDPRSEYLLASRGALEQMRAERLALLDKGRVLTAHLKDDLRLRLVSIFRQARTEVEETGGSTLFLSLGFLKWYETTESQEHRRAPLILIPVELVRPTLRSDFRIRLRDEDPRINETLLERLRRDFEIELKDLLSPPQDTSGLDVRAIIEIFRSNIARVPRFEIEEAASLAFYSFSKFLMWRDLDANEEKLTQNPLVNHLLKNGIGTTIDRSPFPDAHQLDVIEAKSPSHLILDADSSQHVAVRAATQGRTFILQGPPGTGKSQTIANIIAEVVQSGRRVLFVAEKRAALDVVASRLRRVGLGDSCLELHSNKASKKEVVNELVRTLDATAPKPVNLAGTRRRVEEAARVLNGFVQAQHSKPTGGISPFDALSRLEVLPGGDRVELGLGDPASRTEKALERMTVAVKAYASALQSVGGVKGHVFSGCRPREWSDRQTRQISELLSVLKDSATALKSAHASALRLLNIQPDVLSGHSERLISLLAFLGKELPPMLGALCKRPDAQTATKRLLEVAASLREFSTLKESIHSVFEPDVLSIDLREQLQAWKIHANSLALIRWIALRRERRILRSVARKELPSAEEIILLLEKAIRAKDLRAVLEKESNFLSDLIGAESRGAETPPFSLENLVAARTLFQELAAKIKEVEPQVRLNSPPEVAPSSAQICKENLERARDVFQERLSRIVVELVVDCQEVFLAPTPSLVSPDRVLDVAASWEGRVDEIRRWTKVIAAENRLIESGLDPVVKAVRTLKVSPAQVEEVFTRSWYAEVHELAVEGSPALRGFDGIEQESLIEDFTRNDAALIESGGPALSEIVARQKPDSSMSVPDSSEIGILRRESRKKRAHWSVRRLLAEAPATIARLKPCFLMSPLSIAQYLPPTAQPFDLVIFDEASQISTHDAVGAIARGNQIIIVGDKKQLPPTTFFERAQADDDEFSDIQAAHASNVVELESILDECDASQIPSLLLRWHYRSRDESLIAFSNLHYYDGGLITFPSAISNDPGSGVSLVSHDGPFDRGRTRTNETEAGLIVQWIVDALRDPQRRGQSIGVVTFNEPQQTLLENLIEEARRAHPEIEPYFDSRAPEPVFIKNLENVQGDERDVMLFSITYGPDCDGKVSINLGALNRTGGERRLNVAITRARERLIVFSALRPEMIDLSRTRAVAIQDLRSFLRYAANGATNLGSERPSGEIQKTERLIEDEVAERLRSRGHIVAGSLGCSTYRVDLAVADPKAHGRWLLGIETDGATYRDAATARDRERLRPNVLRRLGWSFHRLWSLDWHRDPEAELARIESALELAREKAGHPRQSYGANAHVSVSEREINEATDEKAEGGAAEDARSPSTSDGVVEEVHGSEAQGEEKSAARVDEISMQDPPTDRRTKSSLGLPRYLCFQFQRLGSRADFDDAKSDPALEQLLISIVSAEGPVHQDLAFRRVLQSYEIGSMGRLVRVRLESILEQAEQAGKILVRSEFLWPSSLDPVSFDSARGADVKGETRAAEHLPPEEIAAAAIRVLTASVAIPREDLLRSTATLMGYGRMTNRIREVFEKGLAVLIDRNQAVMDGERVLSPREAR